MTTNSPPHGGGSGSSKDAFLEKLWNVVSVNLGPKLISIVIAFVLWMIVLGSRNVEVTKEIPLELITPTDLVAGNEIPDKIAFRLSGPKAFLRQVLDRREEPIRVNLSGGKPGLITYRFFSDNIRLPIGVKVQSINPTAILIKLEYLKRRDVPVKVETRGAPPEGVSITSIKVTPEVVRIKGPESRVDSVTEVATLPIDISNLKQRLERDAPLDLARAGGIQIDGSLPRVTIETEKLSANFRIKNVEIEVAASHKFKLEEKTVTVLVRASPEALQNIDRSEVTAKIDLSGRPKGKYTEAVRVSLPENIKLVQVIPDRVGVTLY